MDTLGVDPDPMSAADFDRKIRRELPLWEEAVRSAGLAGEAKQRPARRSGKKKLSCAWNRA